MFSYSVPLFQLHVSLLVLFCFLVAALCSDIVINDTISVSDFLLSQSQILFFQNKKSYSDGVFGTEGFYPIDVNSRFA